jgi:hypothetical protein
MKKSIIYVGLISLIILLTGCPGAGDSIAWEELGHGYIYHEPAGIPSIGKKNGEKGIPGWVFEYAYNNEFIVVLEKDIQLSTEKIEKLIISGDFYDYVSKNGFSKYWIIAHVNDSIYGPFNMEQYLLKRKHLEVPKELKFDSEK